MSDGTKKNLDIVKLGKMLGEKWGGFQRRDAEPWMFLSDWVERLKLNFHCTANHRAPHDTAEVFTEVSEMSRGKVAFGCVQCVGKHLTAKGTEDP